MARTLADMTPEEAQACVGMWADCNLGDITAQLIFQGHASSGHPMLMDTEGDKFSTLAARVTPRFDMPRAWNPDGTPVVMRQEWAARLESGGASITRTRAEAEQAHARHREQYENYGTGSYGMLEPPPPAPAGIQHRFTTEWEATDE